ncbi:MAG: SIMPL domain-containing protein [Candidatus Accumulibacter sp.]|uniref:SIMPL domain-containing protein n=1 Tax=Accumulibacter sp. TaxID=2053492 RepID=UPI0019E0EC31|nr:SIMPL domain-containing protein [Accumulibacter sp.]MBE2258344.1 SIMPL domain-containing protein [Paracoccaceae bacterium]MCP5248417.1 SIMPL domain-containing protein [Accumulibacter sp.]
MTHLRPLLYVLPLLAVLHGAPVLAAATGNATTIELAADAVRPAENDLARATVFAEASGATPGELAKQVNGMIAAALKTARTYPAIKAQSGATHTYPVYAKDRQIEGWRMRSALTLESRDPAALSELLGKLQATMGVASLVMLPAEETREKVESEAIVAAIAAFKARAGVIAEALGKPYRIKQLAINSAGRPPIMPVMRSVSLSASAEAAPMPIEAGETPINVSISGQIELLD